MTRKGLVAGLCVLCAAGVASAAPGQPTGKKPQLTVLGTSPLQVRGAGFEPAERVRVLLRTRTRSQARVQRASSTGRLSVRFDVTVPYCGTFTLQAAGTTGSRVPVQEQQVASAYPRRYYPDVECPPASGTRSTS
jgi:hypothetical protein